MALALGLAGCAKGRAPEDLVAVRSADAVATDGGAPVVGALEAKVEEIQKHAWHQPCDESLYPQRLELARALDRRAEELTRFSSSAASVGQEYRLVPMGPMSVRERAEPLAVAELAWTEINSPWSEIWEQYQKVKDTPVSKGWQWLNRAFRGTLADDVMRVTSIQNYYSTPDDLPRFALLRREGEGCLSNENCFRPEWSAGSLAFLATQYDLADFPGWFANPTFTREKKRSLVADFVRFVKGDASRFAFERNPTVRQVAPGHFEVTLDPGPFAAATPQLSRYIESVWRGHGRQVHVRWTSRDVEPNVFRLEMGETAGARSFVRSKDKLVMLFPQVEAQAIAHEIGHVLGFWDNYYTLFEAKDCGYTDHLLQGDLMSNSSTGVVREFHWRELEKQYPLEAPTLTPRR